MALAKDRSLRLAVPQLAPQWLQITPRPIRCTMSPPSFLRPARAVTPMAFVRAIVQGYERYGMDPDEALKAAQITPRELARPGARVTAAQFEALSSIAITPVGQPATSGQLLAVQNQLELQQAQLDLIYAAVHKVYV